MKNNKNTNKDLLLDTPPKYIFVSNKIEENQDNFSNTFYPGMHLMVSRLEDLFNNGYEDCNLDGHIYQINSMEAVELENPPYFSYVGKYEIISEIDRIEIFEYMLRLKDINKLKYIIDVCDLTVEELEIIKSCLNTLNEFKHPKTKKRTK